MAQLRHLLAASAIYVASFACGGRHEEITPWQGAGSGGHAATAGAGGTTATGAAGRGTAAGGFGGSGGATGGASANCGVNLDPADQTVGGFPKEGLWTPKPCDPGSPAFAAARIWQITDAQYSNSVRDVLGVTLTAKEAEITAAGGWNERTNISEGATFTDMIAANYLVAAETVARYATLPDRMTALLGSVTPSENEIGAFILHKVSRLWRRPVTSGELMKLKAIYQSGIDPQDGGGANGFGLILKSVLQAPSFLFRTELGPSATPATTVFQLTPFELAAALSMTFRDSAPDDELWQKAEDGTLSAPDVRAAQVDRLLALPEAQARIALDVSYWLRIERIPVREKDATLFPMYTPAVKDSVYRSGKAFVEDVVQNGTLCDLFTSTKVYANEDITRVYGIPGGTGAELTPVTTTLPERSAGLLTQPAFLAGAHNRPSLTDPVHMGLFVIEELLCGGDVGDLPGPPPNGFELSATMMGTERELAAKRAQLPGCAGCHLTIDAYGLPFQAYDAIGRFSSNRQVVRDENGKHAWFTNPAPTDTSSVVPDLAGPDLKGPLSGVQALARQLSGAGPRRRVAYCAGQKLGLGALGTDAGALNSCAFQEVKERLYRTGSLRGFYRDLATSPGFATRNPGK